MRFQLALVSTCVLLAACTKPRADTEAGSSVGSAAPASGPSADADAPVATPSLDASTPLEHASAAAPKSAPSSSAVTAARPSGPCAGQTPFFGQAGKPPICETACATDADCTAPKNCSGIGQLMKPDGSMGPPQRYCFQEPATIACAHGNEHAFFGHAGAKVCEVTCTKDADCPAPKGCKGVGQLLKADGSMGPPHRYCR